MFVQTLAPMSSDIILGETVSFRIDGLRCTSAHLSVGAYLCVRPFLDFSVSERAVDVLYPPARNIPSREYSREISETSSPKQEAKEDERSEGNFGV